MERELYRIYCDETWKDRDAKVAQAHYVFQGVYLSERTELQILRDINAFRSERGLLGEEIKSTRIKKEFDNASKSGRRNRYEDFLERIFFRYLNQKKLGFGLMYMPRSEYDRVENLFTSERDCHKSEFFFMMYYQFFVNCFLRKSLANQPIEIFIDGRTIGPENNRYDLSKLRSTLNAKHVALQRWKSQLDLDDTWLEKVRNAVQDVSLVDSKRNEFVQLADLVAGCFRYILENQIPRPTSSSQGTLFESSTPRTLETAQDYLCDFFYRSLLQVPKYDKIDLSGGTYNYHFCIFPFQFKSSHPYKNHRTGI